MSKKIFPINTETACLLKWNWSSIYFNSGTSSSCHKTKKYPIDPDNFGGFHNLPEKIQARHAMLNGQWPEIGCESCQVIEQSGSGTSVRQFNLNQLQNELLIPPELKTNASATAITPTIVEVYFTNTCNMACVYCGPHFSSKWEDENRKFKKELLDDTDPYSLQRKQHNVHYDKMVADFWQWMAQDNHYKTIQRYHILGGEPFLLSELDDSIEFWDQHGNPDLVFSVVTNLNIPHERFKSYIKKFERLVLSNKIWKLQLTASLDCWGPVQEYVRWGLDLELWQKNFELLIDRPWINLSINSALSALTIKKLPLLLEKINHWNAKQTRVAGRWKSEPILYSFNHSGNFDNPFYFGPGVFDQDFDHILELMPEDTEPQRDIRVSMQGLAKSISESTIDHENIKKLKNYLDELDVRRKTNWRDHFPWLDQNFSVQYHNDSN